MKSLVALILLGSSLTAFAGGSTTVGPSACSQAQYWCASQDQTVNVCVFQGESASSEYAIVGVNDNYQNFSVSEVPPQAGVVGAPIEFSGTGFDLKICAPGTCAYPDGHLDVPSLNISGQLTLSCQAN